MTPVSRVCQKCRTEILGVAPEGGCSGCLPERALDATGGQVVFGHYKLVKVLSRGGMGIVWLARSVELERMITAGLGDLDKSGIGELTFKDRHNFGRELLQPVGYRAAVRSKIASDAMLRMVCSPKSRVCDRNVPAEGSFRRPLGLGSAGFILDIALQRVYSKVSSSGSSTSPPEAQEEIERKIRALAAPVWSN